MLNHKNSKLNPTEGKVRENKNRGAFILYLYSFCFSPRWRFVLQTEISGKYNSPFDFVSIFVSFAYISFSHSSFRKDPVYCFIWYVTIAILTLTSPIDINAPTRDPLVLVTKDSFVSLVTNLNKKSNVCTVANRTDMKKYWAQYELEPNQKGWLRGYGVIKNNTHFWIHRLSKFQSLLRLIYVRYGPNTCSQRRRVAEANVRSRSRALYGVHLIQVGFTELRAYGQPGVNAWAKCLLQEDELYLFVFLFGLQERNCSEFMDTAFWTELVDKTRQSSWILGGFRQLSLAFSAIFVTIVLFDHYILHYLKIFGA